MCELSRTPRRGVTDRVCQQRLAALCSAWGPSPSPEHCPPSRLYDLLLEALSEFPGTGVRTPRGYCLLAELGHPSPWLPDVFALLPVVTAIILLETLVSQVTVCPLPTPVGDGGLVRLLPELWFPLVI